MFSFIRKVSLFLFDIFFRAQCVSCLTTLEGEARNEIICPPCMAKIRMNSSFFCPSCFSRVPGMDKKCHPDASYILAAAGDYGNVALRSLIHALKYDGVTKSADILGAFVASYIESISLNWRISFDDFLIVPIPLHTSRERARGFNQSFLIAKKAGEKLNLVVQSELSRVKPTLPQVSIKDTKKREENVAGCFEAREPSRIKGRNIILIDDVFTTGATASEAVRALRRAGARKIIALVVSAKA